MCIGFEEGIKEGESPFHKRGNEKKGKEEKEKEARFTNGGMRRRRRKEARFTNGGMRRRRKEKRQEYGT